ncbi:MAG: hypothetical protein N2749_00045 [Clostridia bacterium]|nr:hypothetical protein [Clostridia bacterium]
MNLQAISYLKSVETIRKILNNEDTSNPVIKCALGTLELLESAVHSFKEPPRENKRIKEVFGNTKDWNELKKYVNQNLSLGKSSKSVPHGEDAFCKTFNWISRNEIYDIEELSNIELAEPHESKLRNIGVIGRTIIIIILSYYGFKPTIGTGIRKCSGEKWQMYKKIVNEIKNNCPDLFEKVLREEYDKFETESV